MSATWSFETKQIHAGQTVDPTTGARGSLPRSSGHGLFGDHAAVTAVV